MWMEARLAVPLLIDGHNLIGSGMLEGISLEDEDDELRLVKRLRVWRSNYKGDMTVVFDRGIVGGTSRELSGGGVKVIFARDPQEADDWIKRRIHARQPGLTVVTNDWSLCREARLYDVDTWRADEFVLKMQSGRAQPAQEAESTEEPGAETDVQLSDGELSEWMQLFGPPPSPPVRTDSDVPRRPPSRASAAFNRDRKALRARLQKKRSKR